jgi:hypothetical protein
VPLSAAEVLVASLASHQRRGIPAPLNVRAYARYLLPASVIHDQVHGSAAPRRRWRRRRVTS